MGKLIEKDKKYRILVVDDEPDVLASIVDSIADEKYEIDSEIDSRAALQTIKDNTYDLVLTDLMMPDVSGMDIVSAVKNSGKDTLVVVITGHATLNTAIESLQLGVYDYVRKPFQSAELKSLLNRATEKLDLQRANIALNAKNKRILEKLSFLIEVSKIMYQMTRLDDVIQMVMDTLNEYFGFKRCAFFTEDLKNDSFQVLQQVGMDNLITADFCFTDASYINHKKISGNAVTIINSKDDHIQIDEKSIKFQRGRLYFLPLTFQGQIIGYVILLEPPEKEDLDDEILTLLNVYLAQIAPAIHSLVASSSFQPAVEGNMVHLIRSQLNYAHSILSPVAFTLFRFEFYSPAGDLFSIQDMVENVHKFVNMSVKPPALVKWQAQDTALIIFPETDLFDIESVSVALKQEILTKVKPKEPDAHISLIHACLSSMEGNESAAVILEKIWAKLFYEVQLVKNTKGLVHIN